MKNYFVIILYLIIASCASQGYPTGGPIDEKGPVVINITPLSDNLSSNEPIIIEFDENIDPNSILLAITINQNNNFKLKSFKNKIVIHPDDLWGDMVELYVSRRVQDYQANKMDESVTKIYKNPSKEIENGIIVGELINILDNKIYEVGLYKIINQESSFVKKVESNIQGKFKFINVESGEYRVASIEGDLNNFNYDYRLNRYGMQSKHIIINDDIFEVNLKLMMSDPLYRVSIVSAKMLNSNHAILTLSDESEKSIYIDSNKKSDQYEIGDSIKLNINHNNQLESYLMPSFEFAPNFKKDTLAPKIKDLIFNENLYVTFSEPIKLLANDIFFYNNNPLKHTLLNPFEIKIFLENNFDGRVLGIENSIIDYENNKIDTVLNISIPILEEEQKYGALKGIIRNSEIQEIVVRMTHIETNKQYFRVINNDSEFIFEAIIPGEYVLDSYELKNNKEIYFSGIWNPYQEASRFLVYPEYVDVRAHWEIEGVELNYNE